MHTRTDIPPTGDSTRREQRHPADENRSEEHFIKEINKHYGIDTLARHHPNNPQTQQVKGISSTTDHRQRDNTNRKNPYGARHVPPITNIAPHRNFDFTPELMLQMCPTFAITNSLITSLGERTIKTSQAHTRAKPMYDPEDCHTLAQSIVWPEKRKNFKRRRYKRTIRQDAWDLHTAKDAFITEFNTKNENAIAESRRFVSIDIPDDNHNDPPSSRALNSTQPKTKLERVEEDAGEIPDGEVIIASPSRLFRGAIM